MSRVDEALDELTAVPPRDFAKARAALVARLKQEGAADAAKTVGAMRRPTMALWAVNRLALEATDTIEALIETTVAAASGAASVRVWHITSRGWDPWTERPLPEVVRVAYPLALRQCARSKSSGSRTGTGSGLARSRAATAISSARHSGPRRAEPSPDAKVAPRPGDGPVDLAVDHGS
jgi:hypothetical protein